MKKKLPKIKVTVKKQRKFSPRIIIGIAILFISLFIIIIFSGQQQELQGNAQTAITPTFGTLGDCQTMGTCPTGSITAPSGVAITGSVTVVATIAPSSITMQPCTSAQNANVSTMATQNKNGGNGINGFLQMILQFLQQLLQLLQQLFRGGTTTPITVPSQPSEGVQPTQAIQPTQAAQPTSAPNLTQAPCPPTSVPTLSNQVTLAPTTAVSSAPNGTVITTPSPTPSSVSINKSMIVGVNLNGLGNNPGPDMAGAVNYVRADLKSWGLSASTFTNSGIKVDDLLQGPYSTSGISGLGNPTTWANNALGWYKSDGCNPTLCPIIEILNEPGGTWFWGNNSISLANAAAYDDILIASYKAFANAYGTSRPLILASFDGGWSGGAADHNPDWGQYMWQANSSIGNYMDGITVHPYGGNQGNQGNVTGSYAQAKSLAGRAIPEYITEVGWKTPNGASDYTQQCNNIYNFISWARSLSYIKDVMIFDYRDDTSDGTYGIETSSGTQKPSYKGIKSAGLNQFNPC